MKYKVGDKVTLTNGDTMTVYQINDTLKWYFMREDPLNCYTDEMIEGLVEDEIVSINGPLFIPSDVLLEKEMEWNLPDGYIFKAENGNIINTTKIVLEKKKSYPKTYAECCEIVKIGKEHTLEGSTIRINYKIALLESFQKLLICRDVYWKIAGEEMGLDEPWEPDWNTSEPKYVIAYTSRGIEKQWETTYCKSFAFPTEEMRDAFYENFKELIESVKELL